jgi:hypothetical protein
MTGTIAFENPEPGEANATADNKVSLASSP